MAATGKLVPVGASVALSSILAMPAAGVASTAAGLHVILHTPDVSLAQAQRGHKQSCRRLQPAGLVWAEDGNLTLRQLAGAQELPVPGP